MRQFGFKEPGHDYLPRPAAYAVIFDRIGQLLAVRHRGRLFLPGGGIDAGESCADALHREMREEVGWTIALGPEIGVAGEYAWVPEHGRHYNKIGHFFLAEPIDTSGTNSEEDHEPLWLAPGVFEADALHESHKWAVRLALNRRANSERE